MGERSTQRRKTPLESGTDTPRLGYSRYADQAGLEKHMSSEPVKTMIEAMGKEDLVESSKIVWLQPPTIGFSSRL